MENIYTSNVIVDVHSYNCSLGNHLYLGVSHDSLQPFDAWGYFLPNSKTPSNVYNYI